MRIESLRRSALHLPGVAALSLLGACAPGAPTFSAARTATSASVAGDALHVDTRNGRVSIREDASLDEVVVSATLTSRDQQRLDGAQVSLVRQQDQPPILIVSVAWPDGVWRHGDGASFDIALPGAQGVSVDNANGAVHVAGLAGGVNIKTSNAPVTVEGHAGPVILKTSNGAVVAKGALAGVTADTSNAPITIAGASGKVIAHTSNGVLDVSLDPANAGPVDLDTSNAPVWLNVGPAFSGRVSFHTSNARATLGPFTPAHALTGSDKDDGDGYLEFKQGAGAPSSVSTSNGHVTIRGAE